MYDVWRWHRRLVYQWSWLWRAWDDFSIPVTEAEVVEQLTSREPA